jgi:hypothetical protein
MDFDTVRGMGEHRGLLLLAAYPSNCTIRPTLNELGK